MAIVKGPALSLEASGNLGAICYSRWRSLQIARGTWTGTYPNTSKQQAVNGFMTSVSQYWGTLGEDKREAWEAVARSERWKTRLGDDMTPTGYQLFCKVNCTILCNGFGTAVLDEPPILPNPVYVAKLRLWVTGPPVRVNIILEKKSYLKPLDCDGYNLYKAGPYNSGGRRALEGEYRWRLNKNGYYSDFAVTEGKWYWYRARWYFRNGFVGNWWVEQIHCVLP